MKALAHWAMSGRWQATAAAGLFLAIPLLFWIGAALLALVILRQGWRDGRSVVLWAVLPALAWMALGDPTPLITALSVCVLAVILRQSIRLDQTVMLSSVLGIALYFLLPVLLPEVLPEVVGKTEEVLAQALAQQPEFLAQVRLLLAPMISGVLAALHVLVALLSLLLGRYWQSELYNPAGFGREFKQLRLPLAYSLPAVLVLLSAGGLAPELAGVSPVLTVPMMLAGMALMHGLVTATKAGPGWVALLYLALLMFGPYMYTLLIFVALLDGAFNFRARLKDTAGE